MMNLIILPYAMNLEISKVSRNGIVIGIAVGIIIGIRVIIMVDYYRTLLFTIFQ